MHLVNSHHHHHEGVDTPSIETQNVPQIQVMSPPTSPTKSRRIPHDTGFPEPFGEHRNTTRHHPDADTSPSACIGHEDLNLGHAFKRRRHSFLLKKHKRTLSHGFISPQTEAVHSLLSLSLIDTNTECKVISPTVSSPGLSKDGSGSERWVRRDEDTPPSSPELDGSPKKGLFSRLRRGSNK